MTTGLLYFLEKRAGLHNEDEATDNKDVFQGLIAEFWEALSLVFVHYIDNEDADQQALEGVATLLQVSLCWNTQTHNETEKTITNALILTFYLVSR